MRKITIYNYLLNEILKGRDQSNEKECLMSWLRIMRNFGELIGTAENRKKFGIVIANLR